MTARGMWLVAGLFVACAAVMTGCGGSEPPSETLDPPAWLREADPDIDRATWIRMPASQKDLLRDGALEFDEYASAVRATAACTAAKGHEVTEPAPSAGGMYMAWDAIQSGDRPPAEFYAELSECEEQHSAYIQFLWSLIHPPAPTQVRSAQEAIEMCMADAMIAMPRMDTPEFDLWIEEGGRTLGSNQLGKCIQRGAIQSGLSRALLHDPAS